MSDQDAKSQTTPENEGYEKRDIHLGKVVAYGVGSVIILVILVIFAIDFFTATREEIVYEAVLKPESAQLRDLRAREVEELNSYEVLDARKGVYRIPIDRAMKLIADEAFKAESAVSRDK